MFKVAILFANIWLVFGQPINEGPLAVVHKEVLQHPVVPIVSAVMDNNQGDGSYKFGFVSADGTKQEQEGVLRVYDAEHAGENVRGRYEYDSPEGKHINVEFYADETGYHVFSDDIVKSAGVEGAAGIQHAPVLQGVQGKSYAFAAEPVQKTYATLQGRQFVNQPVVPVVTQTLTVPQLA